ncbi:uncharacterized protein A1O9_09387 [Exophiala aquamarina CBS 119918]|uniref:C2H2-type domain-containing protein n=1 Tax=Exophiala aquamarina CBS 119918 TaxID=1182545 RepID=A0A072P4B9_9EURO|nr:uncharacterized protein A1O9_09387 [Exophiala aquamarina CBS 119918]KEF54944.1 hypothetical protein A1O9_09387 [Exophiala aquamarina CBS 119918]
MSKELTANKRFACSFCDTRFTRKEHQLRHEHSHTQRDYFSCSHCTCSFLRKDVLRRHERSVHGAAKKTDKRPVPNLETGKHRRARRRQAPSSAADIGSPGSGLDAPISSWNSTVAPNLQTHIECPSYQTYSQHNTSLPNSCSGTITQSSDISPQCGREHVVALTGVDARSLAAQMENSVVGAAVDLNGATHDDFVSTSANNILDHGATLPSLFVAPSLSDSGDHAFDPTWFQLGWIDDVVPNPSGNSARSPTNTPVALSAVTDTSAKLVELIENFSEGQMHLPCNPLLADLIIAKLQSATATSLHDESSRLPAKLKCQRYFRCYFQVFQTHIPLIHAPMFDPDDASLALLLVMLAIGALYSFDRKEAKILYGLAETIYPSEQHNIPSTQHLQVLLLLSCFSSWSENANMRASGIEYQQRLADELSLHHGDLQSSSSIDWSGWISLEARKRTVIFAMHLLALTGASSLSTEIAFRNDIAFEMPYEETLWQSSSGEDWMSLYASAPVPPSSREALQNLFDSSGSSVQTYSVLGHLALMVSLHTLSCHYRALSTYLPPLVATQVLQSFHAAMDRWLTSLKALSLSAGGLLLVNPSLASSAVILWEANCIQLHGDASALANIKATALAVFKDQPTIPALFERVARSSDMATAVRHALCFLRGPIAVGIRFMKTTGGAHTSICHFLLGFQCIIFLARWLYTIECIVDAGEPVTEQEQSLLKTVDWLLEDSGIQGISHIPRSKATAAVWAEILGSPNLVWGVGEPAGDYLASNLTPW